MPGKKVFVFIFLTVGFVHVNGKANFNTSENYSAEYLINSTTVHYPRSLIRDEAGDILVVSQDSGVVSALYENGNKTVISTTIIDGRSLGLNHGLAYSSGYLYASNSTAVLRWSYKPGQRVAVSGNPEVVVREIPVGKLYSTRSLIIDRYDRLYVSVGSGENEEQTETRAQIRRFELAQGYPIGGYRWEEDGKTFANGVRNAVGLAFDQNNILWGADCAADDLSREDMGGDIHNTNPADKLLKFEQSGLSYGFPYCWTVDELDGYQKGQQYAWPDYVYDTIHTDSWCQNTKHNVPPVLSLTAHSAPLGLAFYDGIGCNSQSGSFPCSMKGDLFIAFHGSWNRQPPVGYNVVRVPIDSTTQLPTGEIENIIFQTDLSACTNNSLTCLRPVALVFSQNGHLILSSDKSHDIIRVTYKTSSENAGDNSSVIVILKKTLHVPGIVALSIIAVVTTGLLLLIVRKYCCPCRRRQTKEVPYMRETI